jgi:hypothetical protein
MPRIRLSAKPTSVNPGGTSTLKWSTRYANTCNASGGWTGTRPLSGTETTVPLTTTTTYALSCIGNGGTVTESVIVSVTAPPVPTLTLAADPLSIASGDSSTLTWSSTNATSCIARDGWSGSKDTSGSQSTGALSGTTTFTLECSGAGGSVWETVTVTVVPASNTVLAQAAAGFTSGWSAPLDVPSLAIETARLNGEDTLAYPDVSSGKTAWSWASKFQWDNVTRRVVGINSPANETTNPLAQLLSIYDEATNTFAVYENPLNGRTIGHAYDATALDATGRRVYRWTLSGITGPPQMVVLDADTLGPASVNGGSVVGEVAYGAGMDQTTAPSVDYFPGVGVVLFHRRSVWILDTATNKWSTAYALSFPDGSTIHNVGAYNPDIGRLVFGGGSYEGSGQHIRTFYMMDSARTFTRLDDAPVSVSTNSSNNATKACFTYLPGTGKFAAFHNDGNIYLLDPLAAPGSQWETRVAAMDPSNGAADHRWCCALPQHNSVMVGHFGLGGTSWIRLWRP